MLPRGEAVSDGVGIGLTGRRTRRAEAGWFGVSGTICGAMTMALNAGQRHRSRRQRTRYSHQPYPLPLLPLSKTRLHKNNGDLSDKSSWCVVMLVGAARERGVRGAAWARPFPPGLDREAGS